MKHDIEFTASFDAVSTFPRYLLIDAGLYESFFGFGERRAQSACILAH